MKTTWKPHMEHGELSTNDRKELPESVYAFPKQRKEPLRTRRTGRRYAISGDSSASARRFANIQEAAKHYGVEVTEKGWRDLGKHPHTKNPAHSKKAS